MMCGYGMGRGAGSQGQLGRLGADVKDLECHIKVFLLLDKFLPGPRKVSTQAGDQSGSGGTEGSSLH